MKNDENYGYVLIDTLEKKKKRGPIKKGDEIWSIHDNEWQLMEAMFGSPFPIESYQTFRRPLVLPDDPWELVPWEEKPSKKDCEEFSFPLQKWIALSNVYQCTVGEIIQSDSSIIAIRRRKQPAQAVAGWVMTSERVPSDDRDYFAQVARTGDVLARDAYLIRDNPELFTQWLDYPNPEMVKGESDQAFEKFWSREENRHAITKVECSKEDAQIIWNASQDHAKGGK